MALRRPSCSVYPLSVAARLYGKLLFVYPAAYRRKYGPLMVQVFCDLGRDLCRREGALGFLRLCIRALIDVIVTTPARYLDTLQEGDRWMTRKQHRLALIFTGFPVGLGLVLAVANPVYASRMVVSSRSQPAGWLMTAAIFVLTGVAYLARRKGYVLMNQSGSLAQGSSKTIWPRAILACSIVLLASAMFLILFGPAIVTLLNIR